MSGLGEVIAREGHWLIFLNVFLQQIGVPIPAEPTLVVAGGLAAHGRLSFANIAGAALAATLIADFTWFAIGRRYGARALAFVFRLSSAPEARRGQAERLFARWGPAAFAVAKFIPGLPMAGPVLAGGLGLTTGVFLAYDLLAMGLWAGAFAGLGMIFHEDVERVLRVLEGLGGWALLVGGLVACALAARGWRARRRTERAAVPRLADAIAGPARERWAIGYKGA
jgi:membrane protein DedA with SNARE-associated domain